MSIEFFLGVIGGSMIANGLSVVFFYSLFWGDFQKKKGIDEKDFPLWWFAAGIIPCAIAAVSIYVGVH